MSQSAQRGDQGIIPSALTPAHAQNTDPVAASDAPNPSDENASVERAVPTAEIELKLLGNREQLADFVSSPAIPQYARDAGVNTDLIATYYDTPDFALRKSGAVLRVRTDGQRFVMTLKSASRADGKTLERTEWKAPVQCMEPDLAALSQFLPAETFAQVEGAQLKPVFTTEVRRHTRMLDIPLGTVKLAVDQGRIVAGERTEEINEIELELMDGSTAAVFQLAQDLASTTALRPSIRSKSARGFDLALGNPPQITKAPKMKFDHGATLDQVLDGILRSALQHLMESQPAAEDGQNPEGIHQYRVALRRLRSVLGLMRSIGPSSQLDASRDDAKWLMSNFNDARDWDVFITETLPPISQACPAVEGFDVLKRAAEEHRHKAHDKARAAITDPRTGRFQIALGLWGEQAGWRAGARKVWGCWPHRPAVSRQEFWRSYTAKS
ncbi:hypothetical protein GCM10010869_04550 [Mesorhizobium tianshanense]|uniref:CYTH domain-containing protein n=1 Tax=Mesorhizobium tianshanense TaxID=39844 RepID=A0A562NBB1_9HYPH|nr:CYTH and CHAD domain-containing protein [Mesorhizobium tianshanense]TWI29482.1 CYTH domain-containing protein [Mesorhizobium tianshanense]GLS34867.1 hypothetical protein GCM10010869_04550 [Mesorhizobium tianshanense]